MSILQEIKEYKLDFVKNQKNNMSQLEIIDRCKKKISDEPNLFSKKLINENNNQISIIGELKRSSPSVGNIVDKSINLIDIAKKYEINGISCISILTDEKYFNGSNHDLIDVKKHISLPVLRKDFIVDEYQIYESKMIGADCILLILSILNNNKAELLEKISLELGLDVLIEVHNEEEMKRAESMKSPLIGINNRNLNNFSVDIDNSIKISKTVKGDKVIIAESGINSRADIDHIRRNSCIDTFLVGESLMKSSNLSENVRNLIN
jgi:indole-3-glycerol phosphate synthase